MTFRDPNETSRVNVYVFLRFGNLNQPQILMKICSTYDPGAVLGFFITSVLQTLLAHTHDLCRKFIHF